MRKHNQQVRLPLKKDGYNMKEFSDMDMIPLYIIFSLNFLVRAVVVDSSDG